MPLYRKKPVEPKYVAIQLNWANLNAVHEAMGPVLKAHNRNGPTTITKAEVHDTCGEAGPDYIQLDMPGAIPGGLRPRAVHGDWLVQGGPGWWRVLTPAEFTAEFEAVTP